MLSGNPGWKHHSTVVRPFSYIQINGCALVCMYIQLCIYQMNMRARACVCVLRVRVPEWPACPACLAPAYFVSWQHKRVAARCSVVFFSSNLRYCYNSAALCSFVRLLSIWFRFCVINNLLSCVCVRAHFEIILMKMLNDKKYCKSKKKERYCNGYNNKNYTI